MDLGLIQEASVRDALKAIRSARPLSGSPLLQMDMLTLRLRDEGFQDTPKTRAWALGGLLDDLVRSEICALRGRDTDSLDRQAASPDDERELLLRDFQQENVLLESWSVLYSRYLGQRRPTVARMAKELSVVRRTLERRTARGIAALAKRLRALEKEAGERVGAMPGAPAADRIVVVPEPIEAAAMDHDPESEPKPETVLVELLATVRDDARVMQLSQAQVRRVARAPVEDFETYRLLRILEWSQPRYALDERFVDLSLSVDRGEAEQDRRWTERDEHYGRLREVVEGTGASALVVLGSPGSGKSTLLRRFELETAIEGLRGDRREISLFVQLNHYRGARPGDPPPDPMDWLGRIWATRAPHLPPLRDLIADGRVVLLLDGINEMPHSGIADYRDRILAWKHLLHETVVGRPGNLVIFTCRTLDYSSPLSTPTLRVPQVKIQPMNDRRVKRFLEAYDPASAEAIWRELSGSSQLQLFRTPYFLRLLIDHVASEGRLPFGLASLFTGTLRHAIRREIMRDNPRFAPDSLLTERDCRRMVQSHQWKTPYELPESGRLMPKLRDLAFAMQRSQAAGQGLQVSVPYEEAMRLLDDDRAGDIIAAGQALSLLDEDATGEEIRFFHQLLQEYCAARRLAIDPEMPLLGIEWRAERQQPPLPEILDGLAPEERLPPLATTGWEETAILASCMATDPDAFIHALSEVNLPLAARAARAPEAALSVSTRVQLQAAMIRRAGDPEADLRHRIEVGFALGSLGDPRFIRRKGPEGVFLEPPMIEIAAGSYPIGSDDEPSAAPAHSVEVAAFSMGRFPVTNAEWACFMAAGGYEDERWWQTESARAWLRGEDTAEGARWDYRRWRQRLKAQPGLLDSMFEEGRVPRTSYEAWQARLGMSEADFEAHLEQRWPHTRRRAPAAWTEPDFSSPAQPVVGISWFEAMAYCHWLSAQSDRRFRLPTEAEWEAAARGQTGRRYAFGDDFDPMACNSAEIHLRRPSPIGIFPAGDTPEGVSDMTGNVSEWTASAYGSPAGEVLFGYPYAADDGRNDPDPDRLLSRAFRGGNWPNGRERHAASRNGTLPQQRGNDNGFRLAETP